MLVRTLPPGLLVLIDGVKVGRSPVGPLWVPAKPIHIQAIPEDPRRFDAGRDTVVLVPKPGESVTAVLDLRPSVLVRTLPEPASLSIVAGEGAGRDSMIGQTPIPLPATLLERRTFRLEAAEHADSTIAGDVILSLGAGGASVRIAMRRVAPHLPPVPPRNPPLIRRRWFQLALIGAGAALTGGSAVLRHEGDRWYDRYLASSDPEEIPRLYDRTVHYDRLAGATLGSGQVLITAGLFLLVTSVTR